MSLQEVALSCIARGWYVFPCIPRTKDPLGGLVPHGVLEASNKETVIRRWWSVKPDANVAIATSPSELTVWDCDHGFTCEQDFLAFAAKHKFPETYAVRSGRRDSYGVQAYFTGSQLRSCKWSFDGCSGDFRSETGYVMAEGSIHPDTGEVYQRLWDFPLAPLPDVLRSLVKDVTFDLEGTGKLDTLRVVLEHYGIDYEDRGDKLLVRCPWGEGHTSYSGASEAALFVKKGVYCFKCQHSSCDGRSYGQYRYEVVKK